MTQAVNICYSPNLDRHTCLHGLDHSVGSRKKSPVCGCIKVTREFQYLTNFVTACNGYSIKKVWRGGSAKKKIDPESGGGGRGGS